MRKPSGATRCSREPVTAQSRATLPVLGGIFGSTRTTRRRKRLSEALASGSDLHTIERDTLRVEEPAPPATGEGRRPQHSIDLRCGFRFGVGLPVRFIEEIYATGDAGPWASARVLARTIASSLSAGALARKLYAPMDLRIRLDGDEWPRVPIFGLVCASVAEAGLGLKPFRRATEQPGAFQVLGLTAGPRPFALELPRLLLGLQARRDRLLECVAGKVELSARRGPAWFLDGAVVA